MKDENIKEILKQCDGVVKREIPLLILAPEYTQLLLDYITNLQEENERLKELCDKYEEEHNTTFKLWKMNIEEIPTYEEKKELQVRIDKAIEDLKKTKELNDKHILARDNIVVHLDIDYIDYLLNLLQGKSDE